MSKLDLMLTQKFVPMNKFHRSLYYTVCKLVVQILLGMWQLIHAEIKVDPVKAQKAKFMGPTWGPPGSCRPQMGPMLASWTLLSGTLCNNDPISIRHRRRFDGLCCLRFVFDPKNLTVWNDNFGVPCKEFGVFMGATYRKTSSISRTKHQNLNVSCLLLQ